MLTWARSPTASFTRLEALTSIDWSSTWVPAVRRSDTTIVPPTIAPPTSSGAQPASCDSTSAKADALRVARAPKQPFQFVRVMQGPVLPGVEDRSHHTGSAGSADASPARVL